jgi:hypothetical protein
MKFYMTANGIEQESIGIDFLTKLTGYPVWKQTSYNTLEEFIIGGHLLEKIMQV